MPLNIDRNKTVCFTGHRPEKLPDGGNIDSQKVKLLKSLIYAKVTEAVSDGYDTFIIGMQKGVDLWAGEIVMSLCTKHSLHIIAALPYEGMGKSFTGADKWNYGMILYKAEHTEIISDGYSPSCFEKRNRFMVDNSSRLIAVMRDEKSGTGSTVSYARKKGLDVRLIDLNRLFPEDTGQTSLF